MRALPGRVVLISAVLALAAAAVLVLTSIFVRNNRISSADRPTSAPTTTVPTARSVDPRQDLADLADTRAEVIGKLEDTATQITSIPELFARTAGTVKKLRAESCAQSLENLKEVDLFYWPGPPVAGGRPYTGSLVPLSDSRGQDDIEAIVSNRRFLKLYVELSSLDKAEAAKLVSAEIDHSLPEYERLYRAHVEQYRPLFAIEKLRGHVVVAGVPFIIENAPEGKTVLAGVRLKLLSLVWITGLLDLQPSAPSIEKVLRIALHQRDDLYADAEVAEIYKYDMLTQGSLYNRQILIAACLGTKIGTSLSSQDFIRRNITFQSRELTHFDARLTPSDLPVRSHAMRPDFDAGKLEVKWSTPVSDDTFNAFLRAIRVVP